MSPSMKRTPELFDDTGNADESGLLEGLPLESITRLAIARFGMLDHEVEEADEAFDDSADTTRPPAKCRELTASGFCSDDLADSNRGECYR